MIMTKLFYSILKYQMMSRDTTQCHVIQHNVTWYNIMHTHYEPFRE